MCATEKLPRNELRLFDIVSSEPTFFLSFCNRRPGNSVANLSRRITRLNKQQARGSRLPTQDCPD